MPTEAKHALMAVQPTEAMQAHMSHARWQSDLRFPASLCCNCNVGSRVKGRQPVFLLGRLRLLDSRAFPGPGLRRRDALISGVRRAEQKPPF